VLTRNRQEDLRGNPGSFCNWDFLGVYQVEEGEVDITLDPPNRLRSEEYRSLLENEEYPLIPEA
jgi:hypothetical protein